MQRYFFDSLAVISLVITGLIIGAWCGAGRVNPSKQFVSIAEQLHLTVSARGADARLQVFNDSSYGPYSGSIIGIGNDLNNPQVTGIGDTVGIYYRHMRWQNGKTLWTLSLSLAYPLIASLSLPCAWLIRRTWRARRGFPVLEHSEN